MLKDGVMRFLEISFHKDLAKTPYHFCDGEPRYNLNFGRSLKNLTRIYERKIECALFEIPFQKVCHRMSGFFADPSRKLLAIEAPIKIPALDPASVGDVYLDHHYFWDDIFSGSKRHDGFETQSVPAGVTSRNGLSDNYRFVYGNVPRRSIERRVEYQLIDAIESETQFARRLRAEAAAFAA
jgi:hypothetical protein